MQTTLKTSAEVVAAAILPDKPAGNVLGSLSDGPQPQPSCAEPSLALLVSRHRQGLIDDQDLAELKAIAAEFAVQQKLIETHNVPQSAERLRKAVQAYAQDPSPANAKAVQAEKAFDAHEHGKISQAAALRKREIGKRLKPIVGRVFPRFADLIEADASSIVEHDAQLFRQFGLPVMAHPLAAVLLRVAKHHRVVVRGVENPESTLDHMPELFAILLSQAKK